MAVPKVEAEVDSVMGTVPHTNFAGEGQINDMETCTYDESHAVSMGKYHMHLTDCRQKNAGRSREDGGVMYICPYYGSHHIHHSVYRKHVIMCGGYFIDRMDAQKEPLSMRTTAEAKCDEGRDGDEVALDKDNEDVGSEWGEADDNVPITGYQLTGIDEVTHTLQTKADFKTMQKELSRQLAFKGLVEKRFFSSLTSLMSNGFLSPDFGESDLLTCEVEDQRRQVAEYMKEAAVMRSSNALVRE